MAVTYTLRHRPVGSATWTELTGLTSTSQAVTGLTAGTEYEVEVVAVSDGGVSSSPVVGRRWTVFGQPSAPTTAPAGFALTTGDDGENGAIDVTWSSATGAASYTVSHRETGQGDDDWITVTGLTSTTTRLEGLDGATTHEVRVAVVNADGAASAPSAATIDAPAAVASGGTVTILEGGGTTSVLHTFTAAGPGTVTLNRARTVEYLVVGGGGGGAGDGGGGGGGGALREDSHTFASTATIGLVVGAGGTPGAWSTGVAATAGGASSITLEATTYTVPGGGRGTNGPGGGGGAGGTGGSATASGGAGGAGRDPGTPGNAGAAGPTSDIVGASTHYGGGGGGGIYFRDATRFVGGAGGAGGGGDGVIIEDNVLDRAAQPGAPGTGGGGGAGSASHLGESVGDGTGYRTPGGAGGTGVVIVRYALP